MEMIQSDFPKKVHLKTLKNKNIILFGQVNRLEPRPTKVCAGLYNKVGIPLHDRPTEIGKVVKAWIGNGDSLP